MTQLTKEVFDYLTEAIEVKPLITLIVLLMPCFALAQETDELGKLKERVAALEKKNAELYHSLGEKKEAGLQTQLSKYLTLSGLLEVEASAESVHFSGGNSDSASDLTLATAQLGLGITVNENIGGDLILLYEEVEDEDDDIDIDEATINFEFDSLSGRIGRQYVPFGNYYSHFVSDPMTLELGETRETALLARYTGEKWALSGFVFDGDAEKAGDEDHIGDFGASLVLTPTEGVEFGASYLSDLADSDAELADDYRRRVAGWSAYAVAGTGPFELSAEALGAVRSFSADDLDENGNGKGDKPFAWNVEAAVYPASNFEIALRLEGSDELAESPDLQYGICSSWSPIEHLSLSLEYLRGEFDKDFAPADDEDSPGRYRDLVTAQLAIEF